MNRLLILGASGLVGRHLVRECHKNKVGVIGTYSSNYFPGLVEFNFEKNKLTELPLFDIDTAIICSAITKLEKCREDSEHSRKINVDLTEKIISELDRRGIKTIFFSSASVFDGEKGGYKENAERKPCSLYGKQKKEVEDFIFNNINNYLVVRPGKIFGVKKDEGVLFTDWLDKFKKGEKIRCADDEELAVVSAFDIAEATLRLINLEKEGVYNVNPEWHYSRYELAKNFFSYTNLEANIERCSIDDFGFKEKRMKKSWLDSSKFLKETGFKFTELEKYFSRIIANLENSG